MGAIEKDNNEVKRKNNLLIRALNHPLRQEILALLDENKRLIVNDIRNNVRQEQSVVSQHLAILLRVGLVIKDQDNTYQIDHNNLAYIKEISGILDTKVKNKDGNKE